MKNSTFAKGIIRVIFSGLMASSVISTSAGAESLKDFNARVDAIVAEAAAKQSTTPPSEWPAPVTGKKIVIIPCSMGGEGCAAPARALQEAAKTLGWEALLIDGAGDPSKMANAVQRAISIGADGIAIQAIDAGVIAGPLAQAKKAGIKIVAYQSLNKDGLIDVSCPVNADWATTDGSTETFQEGYFITAYAYKEAGYSLKMIQMRADEYGVVAARVKGADKFINECKAAGGDCEILASENYLITDLTTRVPQQAVNLVRRHPNFTVLWAGYDAGLYFMIQGLQAAGLTSKGFAVSFDGSAPNLEIIRKGGFQRATAAASPPWIGYCQASSLNRLFSGQQPVDEGVHTKLLTKDNVPASGAFVGDVDYKPFYEKQWAKK
ncbi:sugar ABC transporter substrate-binding protein [Agrobacterium sp. NPDC090283]|uniref:sugar ABC transporter substrate-binding protein n=1 Tax=Agrobacterium sp. NPDC090283 TaxID=3363920 RepID=UPI003839F604